MTDPTPRLDRLPDDLPRPADDGACDHLPGRAVPAIALASTAGATVDLAAASADGRRLVVYAYPMTGRPGVALPDGWDAIPGARGCTPEACAFRDHHAELTGLGVDAVYGLSTQSSAYQQEMAERLHLPFAVLSDADLALTRALDLPTLAVEGMTLIRRLTLVIEDGRIGHVFYPVFPPDRHAEAVVAWLAGR
jgi:peroxiredoxin